MKYEFNLETYTTFLTANGNRYSGVEAAKALRSVHNPPAHDSISRWLRDQTFEPSDLWKHVNLESSLIIDDTILDKRWSPNNELVAFHWSGNEHKVIRGISVVNMLAVHERDCIPVDHRVYAGSPGMKNKNEHVIDMLNSAKERGFKPEYVMADSWLQ